MDSAASIFHGDLSLAAKLDRARTELLDLSTRNRLLSIQRSSKATKSIEIVDERSAEVFRLLVKESRPFTFLPGRGDPTTPDDDENPTQSVLLDALPQPEDAQLDERGVPARHADTRLQTRMTSKGLQKRLLDLHNDARTLEEEQGVNVLFLALGTLKWIDPQKPDTERHAPLLLVPVRLERGAAGEKFRLRARPEETSSNLSLEEFLERVHALRLPEFAPGEDLDPAAYLAAVAEAVSTRPTWSVQPDDIVLGFFSFAKFLMYRDLDPENWPAHARLTAQPTIRALLSEGFARSDDLIPDDASVDAHVSPLDMLHVVDCDSSQTLAVHEVRRGHSLIIQGPPGTGKSQTIANIVAAAVADGKTVLFVAEKMAALDVVKRRLDQASVGDACLELHSSKASKRLVLDELRRTWDLGAPRGDHPDAVSARLLEVRDVLNDHAAVMHRPHDAAGLTPYDVVGHLARLHRDGLRPTDVTLHEPQRWTPEDRNRRESLLRELAERVEDIGRPDAHPWSGVGLEMVIPTAVERLIARIGEAHRLLASWSERQTALAAALETAPPPAFSGTPALVTLARRIASAPDLEPSALGAAAWADRPADIARLLAAGHTYAQLSAALDGVAAPEALYEPVADLLPELERLPPAFTDEAFGRAASLATLLPRLLSECNRLAAELGMPAGAHTPATAARMVATAERVADAPDASPEAFAATVWDHGLEQAGDLADAVATLEAARAEVGAHATDTAWTTDLAATRQALATHTGFTKLLNADWRRATALVKSVLRDPPAALPELLACLDALARGQAALRTIREGDAFGRSAFGPDWRGERSTSAPLAALVAWMRTLRGLGAEPRLIAGRVPERSALRDRAGVVRRHLDTARPLLSALWDDLGDTAPTLLGDVPATERIVLPEAAPRLAALAAADGRARAAMATPLPPAGRLACLRRIVERQGAGAVVLDGEATGAAAFGRAWQDVSGDWTRLSQAADWVAANPDIRLLTARVAREGLAAEADAVEAGQPRLVDDLGAILSALATDTSRLFGLPALGTVPTAALADRLALWLASTEQLSKWVSYRDRADRAVGLGLGDLVERLRDGRLLPAEALPVFEMAYHEALLADLVAAQPELGRFDGMLHSNRVREFGELDRQRIAASRLEVVRAHHRRIPAPSGLGPVGVLRAEMARKRGHMPIRQLMQKASEAVQALKPVLMMSPLSVAQFLTPGRTEFDLLVMDEASQILPVDALGAIARCRQVVIVGDERQLPPTSFFAKMTGAVPEDDDDDTAQVADVESILSLFTARGLPQRMLRWHYRSRHQSLIAVSNSQFYENKLVIVPSPHTREAGMGLRFHHVPDGVFDTGGKRTNVPEAKLVAQEVIRHARTEPGFSLGVATFSAAQRRAVQDEVEALRRVSPDTEAFFAAHPGEPFFIKNLENVQGDERDVIMISVGYAKPPQGRMSMQFGVLGAEGGQRRLNVLISRAKRRCEVYSSVTDEDFDLDRVKGLGVHAFRLFLRYARTGQLSLPGQAAAAAGGGVLERQVAQALQDRGYQVHPRVGLAGLFIDLAVADPERPGRYLLGVEFDGMSYLDARSARDRDRLRRAVLEDHGWIMHRIWSIDWFQRPQEQLERLVAAIEAARIELDARLEAAVPAARAVPVEVVTVEREHVTEIGLQGYVTSRPGQVAYVEATIARPFPGELQDMPVGQMASLVSQVVATEGPVHFDEVASRLRAAWSLQRAGARIQAAVERGVVAAQAAGTVVREGDFLAVPGQPVVARDRSGVVSGGLRKPEMLPPRELEAAVHQVVLSSLGARIDEVVAAVLRTLGFRSSSAQLRQLVQTAASTLLARGELTVAGDMLQAPVREP